MPLGYSARRTSLRGEQPDGDSKPGAVLLVSHGSGYDGGAEFSFTEALSALRSADVPVIAVLPGPGQLFDDATALGASAYVMTVPRWADFGRRSGARRVTWLGQHLLAILQAALFLRRHRPSVVVTNTMTPPSFAVAARLSGAPHIWMVKEFGKRDHDLHFLLGYERTVRLIASLSRLVTCCSKAVEKSLLEVAPHIKTRVIYIGIDSPALPFRARRQGPLRAALLGRFSEAKGQRLAVEALALARREGADITLTLVGPGETSEVQRVAARLGVQDHVQCKPHTATPLEVWREADVALMCSRAEAFGRVTVEAMRAGLPVCGADSGGTSEIVSDGVNGLLFAPGDAGSLAAALVRLAADEPLRETLAHGAAQTGASHGIDRYGRELLAAIRDVAGSIPQSSSS